MHTAGKLMYMKQLVQSVADMTWLYIVPMYSHAMYATDVPTATAVTVTTQHRCVVTVTAVTSS